MFLTWRRHPDSGLNGGPNPREHRHLCSVHRGRAGAAHWFSRRCLGASVLSHFLVRMHDFLAWPIVGSGSSLVSCLQLHQFISRLPSPGEFAVGRRTAVVSEVQQVPSRVPKGFV